MIKKLSQSLEQYNLLQHPFYLAWNEGKLSRAQLALYAGEYGSFINLISKGWQQAGETAIAKEETEHFVIWQRFASSIGSQAIGDSLPAVKQLVSTSEANYQTYAGALGALYAFEAQQPGTTSSKLVGLRKHYGSWKADETYFEIHANDFDEPALLLDKINQLNETDLAAALAACESTCKALWDALSGIMDAQLN